MPTVKKNVMTEESAVMSGEISFVDDIEFKRFKSEAEALLDDLQSCCTSKKRQIEHWFAKLLDNTSQQILDMPIAQCMDDYLKAKEAEASNKENDEQIVDQSLSDEAAAVPPSTKPSVTNLTNLDYENEIEMANTDKYPGLYNLTSTVKKTTNKMEILKKKFESGINEQSIITKSVDTPVKKVGQLHQSQPQVSKLNDHAVRVIYFLRDLTQISVKLADMNSIDLKTVHESNVDDLKLIKKAVFSK